MNFILGPILLFIGYAMVKKTEWFLENIGRLAFFEEKLAGSGGSRLGYKIAGILFAFFGILMTTGLQDNFLEWLLSPILKIYG